MSLSDAFAPAEAHYKEQVMQSTWGHLAPEKNKSYRGKIVWTEGCYGDITIICCDFEGLDGGPWLYEAVNDFVVGFETEPTCIYEWKGTFRNYHFMGKPKLIQKYGG
jgi:hypothetical protein